MLDFFGKKGLSSFIVVAIIFGLTLVFVLEFNPTAGKKLGGLTEECAARVKGVCIEPKAQKAAYRLMFSNGAAGLGRAAASNIALQGLIERELLIDEAQRIGLSVSDDEITDSIFNGILRVSVPATEARLQRELGIDDGRIRVPFHDPKTKQFDMKVYERLVRQLTGRSPGEFREWQGRELLAAKMRNVVRAPVRVADEEAFDRFASERSTAQVDYVVVRRSWLEKYAISSDPKAIDAWAKDPANAAKILVPVRHILVKFPEGDGGAPTAADKEATKKKADELLARVKKGEDFAKLAAEFSDDPGSKDNGGMYPGSAVAQFVEPFKKAVASVGPGAIVPEVVETTFGYHVIRRDAASPEDLRKAYADARAGDLSREIADKIAGDLKGGMSGEDAVNAAIAKYGVFAPKARAATTTKADADGGAPPQAPEPPLTAATDPERPQYLSSSPFTGAGTPIPGISGDASKSVTKFAFEAKAGDVSAPISSDDGYLVVKLVEKKPATREEFDKVRDDVTAKLGFAKQAEALALYAQRIRENAKDEVKIDTNNVFGQKADAGPEQQGEEDDEGL